MIGKLVVAAFAVASIGASYPEARPTHYPLVRQVVCDMGKGTAFRIKGKLLTASHVSSLPGCRIDGAPIVVTSNEGDLDFAQLKGDPTLGGFPVNCDGFIPGQWYYAIGHARGDIRQTMVTVYATYAKHRSGQQTLIGPDTFIPGMSGGPVLNSRGEVVGIVNAFNPFYRLSFSRALRDTEVCRHA